MTLPKEKLKELIQASKNKMDIEKQIRIIEDIKNDRRP
tara:strand:- start:5564 stop:5677 length:114 start_codon:yes stop_codon:yes gene_type:complete